MPDPGRRLSLLRAWDVRPDFASVNLHEVGAPQVVRALRDRGIGVEAGIWNAGAAETLRRTGLIDECPRILLEPAEEPGDVRANLERIEAALGPPSRPCLLHGVGAAAWGLVELAAKRRYDTRTGFEDTLTLPDGSRAEDNAGLVAAAWRLVCSVAPPG